MQRYSPSTEGLGEGELGGLTVGVPGEYHPEGLSEEVLRQWQRVAGVLQQHGAKVGDD